MRVTDEMVEAAVKQYILHGHYGTTKLSEVMRDVLTAALSHAAGQDGEQCRAASDRAEVAVDLPKIRRLVGPRPMIYMNSWDGQPPCLTLNNACGVIHDLMDEVERLRALSRGVPEGVKCSTCDATFAAPANYCPICASEVIAAQRKEG